MITLGQHLQLGIDSLDQQHQALADLINEIALEVKKHGDLAEHPACCRRVRHLMDQLSNLTEQHFSDEERMMSESDYPDLVNHRYEHRLLMAELRAFTRSVCAGDECLEQNDLVSLKAWFIGHVSVDDRDFANYLLERPLMFPDLCLGERLLA